MTARLILSLSALAANLLAAAGPAASVTPDLRPRLLGAVVAFVISTADHAAPAPVTDHYTPQAALALQALSDTPYHGSLWLLDSRHAISSYDRRHQRRTLRC